MSQLIFPQTAYTVSVTPISTSGIELESFKNIIDYSKQAGRNAGGLILIQNITFQDEDISLPIVALDDKRMMYSFGKNFGQVQLQGTIYNTECMDGPNFESVKKMYDVFNQERLSKKLKTVMLSVATGFKCDLFLTNFRLYNANHNNQSIGFSLDGIVVPPTNKGGGATTPPILPQD